MTILSSWTRSSKDRDSNPGSRTIQSVQESLTLGNLYAHPSPCDMVSRGICLLRALHSLPTYRALSVARSFEVPVANHSILDVAQDKRFLLWVHQFASEWVGHNQLSLRGLAIVHPIPNLSLELVTFETAPHPGTVHRHFHSMIFPFR